MILSTLAYGYVFFQSAGLEALYLRFVARVRGEHYWKKIFLMNALTHPLVVFCLLSDGWMTNIMAVLVAEAFAILGEMFLLRYNFKQLSWSEAFCQSLVANLISWQFAPFLTYSFVKMFL